MTFKVKGGIQVGANVAVDSDALLQQIESTPSVRPTLLLDFAKSKTIDSRATFTRTSNAMFHGQDGYLRVSTPNQPRIEFFADGSGQCEGLLMERTKTNRLPATEQFFDSTYWPSTAAYNAIAPGIVCPDGSETAYKIIEDVSTGEHALRSPVDISLVINTQYTLTIYAKAAERSKFDILLGGGSNWVNSARTASFDLVAGTMTGTGGAPSIGTIQALPNGWFRCRLTATSNATSVSASSVNLRIYDNSGSGSYTGDGVSGLYVWGAQLEIGDYPSSYIRSNPTFTSRSSNATYQDNADGLIKTALSNVVRFNYNSVTRANTSLMLEASATNLYTTSETLGGGSAATITNNSAVAPDGTTTATLVTEDTSTSRHYTAAGTPTIVANSYNTGSVYVKAGTRTRVYVTVGQSGSPFTRGGVILNLSTGSYSTFNISTAPLAQIPFVQYVANGWYRVGIAVRTNTTDTTIYMEIGGVDNSNNLTYVGTSSTFFVWGVQMEAGVGMTSYIKTTGATATRSADVYSTSATTTRAGETFTIPVSSVALKPYEGTVAIEGRFDSNTFAYNQYIFGLGDTTINSLISYRMQNDNFTFLIYNSGSAQGFISKSFSGIGNNAFKTAAAYSNTGFVASFDGGAIQSAGPGIGVPPYGIITIGGGFSSGAEKVYIKNIAYYPVKLSNTELISITSS